MAQSTLYLHTGARKVSRDELAQVPTPGHTQSWYPISHRAVLDRTIAALGEVGFHVKRQQLSLSRSDQRFFGTLDLGTEVVDGIGMAIGIRNSHDKCFPIGFCCGERVFCCDNLAFASEIVVTRKHTRHAKRDFDARVTDAVSQLHSFKALAEERIGRLQAMQFSTDAANSRMLQAYEQKLIGARVLPKVIDAWKQPSHEQFEPRTGWSLLNAFTEALKDRQDRYPGETARQTIRVQNLIMKGHPHATNSDTPCPELN